MTVRSRSTRSRCVGQKSCSSNLLQKMLLVGGEARAPRGEWMQLPAGTTLDSRREQQHPRGRASCHLEVMTRAALSPLVTVLSTCSRSDSVARAALQRDDMMDNARRIEPQPPAQRAAGGCASRGRTLGR